MTVNELFQSVVEVLQNQGGVTTGRMFGSSGLKVNGKVFAMLVKGNLVVKLPRERVEALVISDEGEPFNPGHGRISKEWVAVKPGNEFQWLSLAQEARDFVLASH